MKKKILGTVVMAAVALTAGWNISQSENDVKFSDLALDNVEALAECEKTGGSCWLDSRSICCDAGDFGCSPCGY